jgi:hypothetical protein
MGGLGGKKDNLKMGGGEKRAKLPRERQEHTPLTQQ